MHDIKLLSCKSGEHFAKSILINLNELLAKENNHTISLTPVQETRFANTEIKSNILESIRGTNVFIVQDVSNNSNGMSVDDNLRALITLIDAARVASARRVSVILPVFPYARQDKIWGRECLTARIIARELEMAGAEQVITLDIHNPAITGFFEKAILENLYAKRAIRRYIVDNISTESLVISSPDVGGMKRATELASKLGVGVVSIYKERDYSKANQVDKMELIGNVKGKNVILVDDMLDTGGTLVSAVNTLKEKGANKVYFACSLGLLNGSAVSRIDELYKNKMIEKVIVTDAVYREEDFTTAHPWLVIVEISPYFAKAIYNIQFKQSINQMFDKD
ncbi:MAG: ribose-phosphate pyrophosphokinase [archaeon]|jgi:ribose-phosphate pyrophosphokinase